MKEIDLQIKRLIKYKNDSEAIKFSRKNIKRALQLIDILEFSLELKK
jgi:hypothetical protein